MSGKPDFSLSFLVDPHHHSGSAAPHRYVGPRKRQSGEDRIARFVAAACELKMPKLAEELQAAFAHNQGTLPEGLRASRDGSFTIAQPLRAVIRGCVRHACRVLRRRTGARGR